MPNLTTYKTREEYNEYYRIYRELNKEKMRAYNREYNKRWRKKYGYHNELNSKLRYPEKEEARRILSKAVAKGEVLKAPCLNCGNPNSQAHHHDYSLPLEVVWLCPPCHAEEHKGKDPGVAKDIKVSLKEWQEKIQKRFAERKRRDKEFKKIRANRLKVFKKEQKRRSKRGKIIKILRAKNMTLQQIGDKFGISRERVRQLLL